MSIITDQLRINCKNTPSKKAIICGNEAVTYEELIKYIDGISMLLHDKGLAEGDNIGLLLPNGICFVLIMFAAANIGVSITPLSPNSSFSHVNSIFEMTDVKLIVMHKNLNNKFSLLSRNIWSITDCSDLPSYVSDNTYNSIMVDPDCDFIITATSGSTGAPKPIVLTQRIKFNRSIATKKLYHLTSEDVILSATPLHHSLAERLVILPLIIGATAVILKGFTPQMWLDALDEHSVTFTIAVSSQLHQISILLQKFSEKKDVVLKCLVSSSDSLNIETKNILINQFKCPLYEIYGTSEVAAVSNICFQTEGSKVLSVGRPVPEAKIKIYDLSHKEVECGEIGEIVCKTELMFKEYFKMPEETKASKVNEYFLTGDRGYVDNEGYLYFSGRIKEIIISGGINIYPQDIENAVKKINGVEDVMAFGLPDMQLGEVVALAVISKRDISDKSLENMIKRICVERLSDYQMPRYIFFCDSLPYNELRKPLRSKLIEQYEVMVNKM